MARLVSQGKEERSKTLGSRTLIGRDREVELTLTHRDVSRRHACIERRKHGFFLSDLDSTNGTFLNGRRITAAIQLRPGDHIRVGVDTFQFEDNSEAPTQSTPENGDSGGGGSSMLATTPLTALFGVQSEDDQPLPRRTGKFNLLKLLGKGGMGKIYLARDLDSGQDVAVKLIRSQIARRERFLELFHNREAALARQIDHPNVVRVYEHGVTDDHHYISMEFCRGANLLQILRRTAIPFADALEMVKQVACGLDAAHRQGVVHSDIKPSNILVVEQLPERDGGDDTPTGPAIDEAEAILEFDASDSPVADGSEEIARYDSALLEEIRRRIRPTEGRRLGRPPFFPRPSEMRFLEHYLEHAIAGQGHFVLVQGEGGTGKTQLIDEFLARSLPRAEGEASEVRVLELDASQVSSLRALHAEFAPGQGKTGDDSVELVRDLLERARKRTSPVVLRVREVATAHRAVLSVLARLVRAIDEATVLLIADVSPGDVDRNSEAKDLIASLSGSIKELYLRPLTEYQVQRFLEHLFEDTLTGVDLARDVYRLSRGNFARVLEVLRGFFDRKLVKLDSISGRLHYRPSSRDVELEEGKDLHERLKSRSKIEQQVLEAAAFVGRRFFFDPLQRLTGQDETALFFLLKNLCAGGFLAPEERSWYRFPNGAFQRFLAERTPERKRAQTHRKVAKLLQTTPVPESTELLLLRARHHRGCADYVKAVHCFLEAAHYASSNYRHEAVQEAYHEILSLYRTLRKNDSTRKLIVEELRRWFRRDGNWYEILGKLASDERAAWVKIADFGISFRLVEDDSQVEIGGLPRLGTPRYMAPERVQGKQGGPAADIFALGIVLYELVVREPPFRGLRGAAVMKANEKKPIRLPDTLRRSLPKAFVELFDGMVAQNPANRWSADHIVRQVIKLQFEREA